MTIAQEAHWPRERLDADYTARHTCSPEDFERIITLYAERSRAALDLPGARTGITFDKATGLSLDLFGADPREPRPLVIFIHGGYWRALSKEHSAFMAPMLARNGIVCAVPDYRLAPGASISDIVDDARRAFAFLWREADTLGIDRGRITVTGSSAGGHLAAAIAQPGWQQQHGLPPDCIHAAMPVSGLFELAPLSASHVQGWMRFTPGEIEACSPLRHLPQGIRLSVALAEHETPGFVRQSQAYADATGAPLVTIAGRNHFDVILDWCDETTELSRALLRLCEAG